MQDDQSTTQNKAQKPEKAHIVYQKPINKPLPNYTLSTVCPACNSETYKLACKIRCPRCGFVWDCSEL